MNAASGFVVKMRCRTILAAVVAIAPLSGMALDLTPHIGFRGLEDINVPIVELTDGAAKVCFQPPAGWQVRGGRTLLHLTPPNPDAIIVDLRIDAVNPPDPAAPEDVEKWCRKFLPPLATQIALAGDAASPFTLHGLPSREFTFSYAYQARRFTASVAVVDLSPGQRLSLIVIAHPDKFKPAHESVVRSMFTFEWQDGQAAGR